MSKDLLLFRNAVPCGEQNIYVFDLVMSHRNLMRDFQIYSDDGMWYVLYYQTFPSLPLIFLLFPLPFSVPHHYLHPDPSFHTTSALLSTVS